MNPAQREAFLHAVREARADLAARDPEAALPKLQRAHILGQAFVGPHVLAHWLMLRVAVQQRQSGAALGQIARIVLGGIGSAVGVVPTGNRGSSDVSMFLKEAIPEDLARLMSER